MSVRRETVTRPGTAQSNYSAAFKCKSDLCCAADLGGDTGRCATQTGDRDTNIKDIAGHL